MRKSSGTSSVPSRVNDINPEEIESIEEPVITAKILTNEEYVGGILKLVEEKRGNTQDLTDFFNQARKALNTHQKLLEMEPDISKPVIEGAKQ